MKYRQLSEFERYPIDAEITIGMSIGEIARKIGRPRCTIFRALKSNAHLSREGYSAPVLASSTISEEKSGALNKSWAVHGVERRPVVDAETIYRYVYRDRKQGG